MDSVHLIIGLGNPGARYATTRHNIGFLLVEKLGRRWTASWREQQKFEARCAVANLGNRKVVLCQPQTFMNASGRAARSVMDYYHARTDRVLVCVDDADLPLGELRMRPGGGTGGHHGLESVERHLGTEEYARLRLGIGRGVGMREITGHVLGRFGREDEVELEAVLKRSADQVECWIESGIQKAMNNFNGMVDPPKQKGTGQ